MGSKILRNFLLYLLVGGVIASIGFLSLTGLLLLYPQLAVGILACILSGVVEGEVYKQNLKAAFKRLLHPVDFYHRLILKSLDNSKILEKLNNSKEYPSRCKKIAGYLQIYQEKKSAVSLIKLSSTSTCEQGRLTAKLIAEKELRLAEQELLQAVKNFSEFDKLVDRAFFKTVINHSSWLITIPAGIGVGFATVSALKTGLLFLLGFSQLTLPLVAMSAIIWPLSILAAIGYTLMLYQTISDMIESNFFKKCKKWFRKFFRRKEQESIIKFTLRLTFAITLTAAAIALSIFATVATAGSWWFGVKKAVLLVPYFDKIAESLRTFLVCSITATQFIFNAKNSFDSAKQFIKYGSILKPIRKIKDNIYACWEKENIFHFINPFRFIYHLIKLPLELAMFIGHLISIGFTTDSLKPVPNTVTATLCAGSELFQDANYLDSDEEKNLLDYVLIIALSPLKLCSNSYDFIVELGLLTYKNILFTAEVKKAFCQSFGIKSKEFLQENQENKAVNFPSRIDAFNHIKAVLSEEIGRLQKCQHEKKVCEDRVKVLTKLKEDINSNEFKDKIKNCYINNPTILNQHRYFSSEKPTRTRQVLNYLHQINYTTPSLT